MFNIVKVLIETLSAVFLSVAFTHAFP